jgi:hypothetical protein
VTHRGTRCIARDAMREKGLDDKTGVKIRGGFVL